MPSVETSVTYHRKTYPYIDPSQPRAFFAPARAFRWLVAEHGFPADIVNAAAVNELFVAAAASAGPIDIGIKNAAFLPAISAIQHARLEDWWRGFELNVLGMATVTQAFLRTKQAGQRDTVISINTSVAHCGVFPAHSSYTASKMVALRMTECFPAESTEVRFVSQKNGRA